MGSNIGCGQPGVVRGGADPQFPPEIPLWKPPQLALFRANDPDLSLEKLLANGTLFEPGGPTGAKLGFVSSCPTNGSSESSSRAELPS